jgi:O-antigen/teichoic acid export membrane protein
MQRYLSIYRSNPFVKNNLVFFLGSVAVGALNYLYYPVIGRLMDPSAFGEVQTLISLFLQLAIFLNVLSLVAVNLIANGKDDRAQAIVSELQLAALWVSVGTLVVTILVSAQLQSALHFSSPWPFILLAVALIAAVPFTFQTAYLRGRERFGATSFANLLVAGGKIVFSIGLVIAGFGAAGAIGGLIAAQVVALGYAVTQATNGRVGKLAHSLRKHWWPDIPLIMGELKYVGFALVGSLAVMLLLSLDVIVVKYFFDAHTAGLYAGIATVARIIFFLTASIAQVLLPAVKLHQAAHENRKLLVKSLFILSALSLPVLAVCTIRPEFVMHLLMGAQYTVFSSLLTPLAWAIFFVSIANLLVSYCLALRQYVPAVLAMIGTIVTYGVMFFRHDSLADIVTVLLWGGLGATCLVAGWVIYTETRSPKNV